MRPRNRSRVKKGSEVFSSCPACESPNLIKFEDEVICSYCSWDSISIRVEARFGQNYSSDFFETAIAQEETAALAAEEIMKESAFLEPELSIA